MCWILKSHNKENLIKQAASSVPQKAVYKATDLAEASLNNALFVPSAQSCVLLRSTQASVSADKKRHYSQQKHLQSPMSDPPFSPSSTFVWLSTISSAPKKHSSFLKHSSSSFVLYYTVIQSSQVIVVVCFTVKRGIGMGR